MKVLTQRLIANPTYAKLYEWGRLLTITGSAQIVVQALGLVGGILVIRLLPTQEYAFYTLANTMLGTMAILADGGISAGVMAQGGRVWQDREKLGVVLVTGLALRKWFAVVSLLVATPILFYLLRAHGASWVMAIMLSLSLIPAFISALSGTFLQVAPKLRQDIAPLQRNQLEASLGRLLLLSLSLFSFPWAFVAILASGLPQVWANSRLHKLAASYTDWSQQPSLAVRQEIIAFVKRILPGSIYYCLSGQITIWIVSVFGATAAIAQVGALGRLAVVLGLFSTLFATLVAPRFARLPSHRPLLLTRYLQTQVGLLLLSAFIVGIVWLFPTEILWILGRDYANLQTEVVLNTANSCLAMVVGASFAICTSRGWAIHPMISIPVTIAALVIGVVLFPISSLKGVLMLNILVTVVEFIMYFSYVLLRIKKV